jgi:hypothetical protein
MAVQPQSKQLQSSSEAIFLIFQTRICFVDNFFSFQFCRDVALLTHSQEFGPLGNFVNIEFLKEKNY